MEIKTLFAFDSLFCFSVLINLIKISFSKLFTKVHISGFPYYVMIEPSSRCNLQCPMYCLTLFGLKNWNAGDMDFLEFKKVYDKISPYLLFAAFWNLGEPLMNKDLFKMISYSHSIGIFNVLTTNGNLLNSERIR